MFRGMHSSTQEQRWPGRKAVDTFYDRRQSLFSFIRHDYVRRCDVHRQKFTSVTPKWNKLYMNWEQTVPFGPLVIGTFATTGWSGVVTPLYLVRGRGGTRSRAQVMRVKLYTFSTVVMGRWFRNWTVGSSWNFACALILPMYDWCSAG